MRFVFTGLAMSAALCWGVGDTLLPAQAGGGQKPKADEAKELEGLKGTWQVTSIMAGGKPVPADRVKKINLQYVFDGNKLTVRRPDRPDNTFTVTIDTGVSPKRLTFNQKPPVRAVFAREGNKLRLCLMVDENPNTGFPTELASKASPTTDLLTLEKK